ncbi:hypothetical protein [Streptantibioticus silvisoli]|uniref:Uncharacterized protein n=1 Tax=Streptantibioticus silvisoli TaxID=2705255 RepID=A0ABT6W4Q7_9ACTN|nr:hypothetical protein [Streptantibioticus silvisoli]MDI5965738.1 hypothetical protein [Streptantibioticus silvisoli]
MPTACPGSHNTAWRQAEADGQPHNLQPAWGNPLHCTRCTERAHRELAQLPELLAAIWLEATNGTRGLPTGTIGRSPTHPAWPGQASRLITDHIIGGLIELEADIRGLRGLTGRSIGRREGVVATQSVTFLAAHLDWALEYHPAAGETHDRLSANPASQIHQWNRAATRFTARDERLDHHRVPCPRCELLTLFRADGDDYIECRNTTCGLLLTPGEYFEHTKTLAAGHSGQVAA